MSRPVVVGVAAFVFAHLAAAQAPDSTHYVDVFTGPDATCVLRADGAAMCTGRYARPYSTTNVEEVPAGRCGITLCDLKFVRVKFTPQVQRLTDIGCGLSGAGMVVCISDSYEGPTPLPRVPPAPQTRPIATLSMGMRHACMVEPDGGAYCRGDSGDGQLGIGPTEPFNNPCPSACKLNYTRVVGAQTWTGIAVGSRHTCGIASDKKAYCWGLKSDGRLGDGAGKDRDTPSPVAGDLHFTQIVAGDAHACALAEDGKAYCWGRGKEGQLGSNTTTALNVPSVVSGGFTFAALFAGYAYTCGLTAEGKAYCWGKGDTGQLGSGQNTKVVPAPIAVVGDVRFSRLSLADDHSCGLTQDRSAVYCWGKNGLGQLGTGDKNPSLTPLKMVLP